MSNSLLESLWARVSANIGDRIEQINGLFTQALSANTESIAARDAAVAAEGNAATSDRKSTRLNSSHSTSSRMPSSA